MSDQLKREIVMMAVQRRVLPLQGETAVQHAVRLYKIAQDCMAALEDKVKAEEPAPAAPSEVFVWGLPLGKKWVTISKQLKD
jgi:hypothetical protein